ncbi:MAG TPA: TolC family protein [Porticoccaceae bacterium]|nr:TolC family protein [Porticoccaceae bacterium]
MKRGASSQVDAMKNTRHLKGFLYCALTMIFFGAGLAGAATPETLETAWEEALSGNLGIQAALEEQLAAKAQVKGARAQRIPNFALAAKHLKLDSPPTITTNFALGGPLSVTYWDEESTYYGASTTLPLYTGGRISADIAAAEAQQSAATANTSQTISAIKLTVAAAYIEVLRAQSSVKVAQGHVKSLASHRNDVNNLLRQGLVARNQLLMADVSLAGARQARLQAQHQLELAGMEYNRLLNRPLDTTFELMPIQPQPVTQSLSELDSQALDRRADLKTLTYRATVLEKNAQVARAASKPQVGLTGTYLHHDNRILNDNDILAAHVTMAWQVFDGGITGQRGRQFQHQAAAVKARQEELKALISQQIRAAWLAVDTARERQRLAGLNIEQAEENLRTAKNRYRSGLITSTEVFEAERLRIQAHHDLDNALHDSVLATLQLKHAAGIL